MMEILGEELSTIGLEMHESKTKILTSISEHQYHFVEVYGMMIELLPSDKAHRYLGRMVSLNSSIRCGVVVISSRFRCGVTHPDRLGSIVNSF